MKQFQQYIGFVLAQAGRAHRMWADEELSKLGLRAGQEMILSQLWLEEGLTQTALAERMGVEQPTISIMLKRLEKAALVRRQLDPDDARVSRVYLTTAGRILEKPVLQVWQTLEEKTVEDFSLAEQLLFRRLLCQTRDNLKR